MNFFAALSLPSDWQFDAMLQRAAQAFVLSYGVVTAMWLTRVQDRRWRACLVLAATLMVLLVALSRLYLSVHYLSDVVAGLAEGLVWLALCLTASNRLRQR